MITPVEENSLWKHTNGNIYRVLFLTNTAALFPEIYPITVVYKGMNGNVWSRPLSDWHRSMTIIGKDQGD